MVFEDLPKEEQERLKLCMEYREERLDLEAWRKYDNGIVLASRFGERFLEEQDERQSFLFFGDGKGTSYKPD